MPHEIPSINMFQSQVGELQVSHPRDCEKSPGTLQDLEEKLQDVNQTVTTKLKALAQTSSEFSSAVAKSTLEARGGQGKMGISWRFSWDFCRGRYV